jgi:hypothetical protein
MRRGTLVVLGLTAVGLVGLLWRSVLPDAGPPASPAVSASRPGRVAEDGGSAPPAATDLAALAAALEEERAARRVLAAEVASLRAEVAKLPRGAEAPPVELAPDHPGVATTAARAPALDEQALRDVGFGEREAQQLHERMEGIELERLYLRDRAVREGWVSTPRFAGELRALDAKTRGLRVELGDERYDWLLYASGQSNRVVVQSVLDRSPASVAGLRSGDAIVAYDGARVFDGEALRDATSQGRPGETVAVEVARGDRTERLFVPRGPLGIRLEEARLLPGDKP